MSEFIRLIGTQKTEEHGDVNSRYYQAIVGVGYPIIVNHWILRRKWDTKSAALKYKIDFFCVWVRFHKET